MEDWDTGESLILQHKEVHNAKLSSKEIIENLKMQEVMWEPTGRTISKENTVFQGEAHAHLVTEMYLCSKEVVTKNWDSFIKLVKGWLEKLCSLLKEARLFLKLWVEKRDSVGDFNPQKVCGYCAVWFTTSGFHSETSETCWDQQRQTWNLPAGTQVYLTVTKK